jgi:predicted phage tail protein
MSKRKWRKWKAPSYSRFRITGDGGGSGKGGGGGSEAANSARSRSFANVLIALSEGEIKAVPDGQDMRRYIYFDETVLMNPDGTLNFKGVSTDLRSGTQGQSIINGAERGIFNNVAVGVKVTHSGGAIIRSVSSNSATAIRLTITTPGLRSVDGDGNINGSRVDFGISLSTNGGAFVNKINDSFDFKTAGGYSRDYTINVPPNPGGTWQILVFRGTNDSTSDKINNEIYWQSISTVTERKLRYPNTAKLFVRLDAAYFRQIPRISFKALGLIVRVPNNYDSVSRQYTGFWDGSWKLRYSNNPAWILLEFLTNKRFGCGDYIDLEAIDKGSFYKIARRCDEMVSNGNGGMEPRYVMNEYFRSGEDAWPFLNRILASINCLAYYSGGQIVLMQDAPGAPIGDIFTQANVITAYGDDGKMTQPPFRYERTSQQAIHTVALCKWNDPNDFDRVKTEYVDLAMLGREADLRRLGYRPLELAPAGCTSRSQAARYARHALATEILERELVYFGAGSQGMLRVPGDIVRIQDNHRSRKRLGGRVKSATNSSITLDSPVEIANSNTNICVLIFEEEITKTVNMPIGNHQTLQIFPPFSELPEVGAVWVLSTPKPPKLYAVRTISEDNGAGTYGIGAVAYSEDKWLLIDQVASLPPSPATSRARPQPPTNLEVLTRPDGFFVGWNASVSRDVIQYAIETTEGDSNDWHPIPLLPGSTDVDVPAPTYNSAKFRVTAINIFGRKSDYIESDTRYQGFGYIAERLGNGAVRLDRFVNLLPDITYYLRTAEDQKSQIINVGRLITNQPGVTDTIEVTPDFKSEGAFYGPGAYGNLGALDSRIGYIVVTGVSTNPNQSTAIFGESTSVLNEIYYLNGRSTFKLAGIYRFGDSGFDFPIRGMFVPDGMDVYIAESQLKEYPVPGSSWRISTNP